MAENDSLGVTDNARRPASGYRSLKLRLSIMMFLEYAVPAATLPILSLYLRRHLGFEPYQTGLIMAMPAISALVAPFIVSRLADRYISAERLLAVCQFLCAVAMITLYYLRGFYPVLAAYFAYGFFFMPTFGLTNTVALHHAADARRDFAGIRLWGTVGWIVVAWVFGYWWLSGPGAEQRLPHALLVSAGTALLLALYALTFSPSVEVDRRARARTSYREILRVFAQRGMALLCFLTFLNGACQQFYYFGMGTHLDQLGYSRGAILPAMSLGQMTEVLAMALLGFMLVRISMKWVMVLGLLAQCLRFTLFAAVESTPLILLGLALHGFCYALFFTTAYIYIDQHSNAQTRAGVQQLLTLLNAGFGYLAGHLAAGWAGQWLSSGPERHIDYHRFWLIPLATSAVITCAMIFAFPRENSQETPLALPGGPARPD
jgi:NHS family xanthosine MFS transporter